MWVEIEILGIIEPYTDKALSEGCYIEIDWEYITSLSTDESYIYQLYTNSTVECIKVSKIEWDERVVTKILWHYDITAVLKFVRVNRGCFNINESWDYFEIKQFRECEKWIWAYPIWEIPNKPLNLYNEQENTLLLKILKELC